MVRLVWIRLGMLLAGFTASACAGRAENSNNDASSSPPGTVTTGSAGGASSSSMDGTVNGTAQTSGTSQGGSGGVAAVNTTGSGGFALVTASSSGDSSGGTNPTPPPCNSSDGSGCNAGEICLDVLSDACAPTSSADCTGYCAPTVTPPVCDGGLAQCNGTVTCPSLPPECPAGLVASISAECWGPCVPADCCACTSEEDCPLDDVSCALSSGRCVVPAAPEPRCLLPPDPEDCPGSVPSFVFIDGECKERPWGRCDGGSDNRFDTLEECLRRCQGLPQQGACPEGREPRLTCLACGLGGGCRQTATVCAKSCETTDDCESGLSCANEICGVNGCI